jgi:DNA-binding transcriptional ArsR family regulator
MEINFNTVKALSSPTRVKILNEILEKEATPTKLSNELGKSKSTVSSHLTTLHKADLIEKDEEEGRRRVTYSPTNKAQAIIEGRERKVRFSFGSSAVSALAGLSIGGYALIPRFGSKASYSKDAAAQSEGMSTMSMDSADAGAEAARTASETASGIDFSNILFSSEILLGVGLLLLGIAVFGFIYGWTVNKLGE